MSKKVFLTVQDGDFQQGFPVILRIQDDADGTLRDIYTSKGKLPPSHHVDQLFSLWQKDFRHKVQKLSRGKPGKITQRSSIDTAEKLTAHINNDWLNSGESEWRRVREDLLRNLNKRDEILIIIQTDSIRLKQLPWSVWDVFSDYPNVEIVFSSTGAQPPITTPIREHSNVRCLVVFGKSDSINIEFDKNSLNNLGTKGAEIEFLNKPTKRELLDRLCDERGWHIFFFAGHSESQNGEIGRFDVNENERLEINELKNSLKTSIAHGLVLAIFNSCEGLGLANQLAMLHLPQSIVMREPVPDEVAQDFLQVFLKTFAGDSSLYASVRRARERLEDLWDREYPGASWLPMIYQNPTVNAPRWDELCFVGTAAHRPKDSVGSDGLHKEDLQQIAMKSISIEPNEDVLHEPGFDFILKNKSPELFAQLQMIREKVMPDLSKIPDDEYSQDSANHVKDVLNLVYRLYSPALEASFFNAKELFVLAALCLLHDVGMMPRTDCPLGKKLYKNHCRYSYDYVKSMVKENLLDDGMGEIIAHLCKIHNKRIGDVRTELKHLESTDMHVVLIYAMFKIADMLELEQQPGVILRLLTPTLITKTIGDINIDSEYQAVTLYPAPKADPEYLDSLVQEFSDYFQEAAQEFNLIGLHYRVQKRS